MAAIFRKAMKPINVGNPIRLHHLFAKPKPNKTNTFSIYKWNPECSEKPASRITI